MGRDLIYSHNPFNCYVTYSLSLQDVRPLGAIMVSGCHISSSGEEEEKTLTFRLSWPTRTMHLAAEKPEDLGRWINTIARIAKTPEVVSGAS